MVAEKKPKHNYAITRRIVGASRARISYGIVSHAAATHAIEFFFAGSAEKTSTSSSKRNGPFTADTSTVVMFMLTRPMMGNGVSPWYINPLLLNARGTPS